jgi:hypothetical protein
LSDRVSSIKALRLIDPLGYLDFLNLSSSARLVLTDSGGIQEETTALGIPCLTLRENTERPITVEMGTNIVVGTDTTKIIAAASATLNGSAKKNSEAAATVGRPHVRAYPRRARTRPLMPVLNKIKRALRGEVKLTTAAREALRRSRVSLQQRKERASLDESEPLALTQAFARMSVDELSEYFRGPREAKLFDELFAPAAAEIGFGEQFFGNEIEWRRDPLSNYVWPLDYHRDLKLMRADGSDVRVLWELNRLGISCARTRYCFNA